MNNLEICIIYHHFGHFGTLLLTTKLYGIFQLAFSVHHLTVNTTISCDYIIYYRW